MFRLIFFIISISTIFNCYGENSLDAVSADQNSPEGAVKLFFQYVHSENIEKLADVISPSVKKQIKAHKATISGYSLLWKETSLIEIGSLRSKHKEEMGIEKSVTYWVLYDKKGRGKYQTFVFLQKINGFWYFNG